MGSDYYKIRALPSLKYSGTVVGYSTGNRETVQFGL